MTTAWKEGFEPKYPKAMAFKLMETAQKKWLRLRGYQRLAEVISGATFANGIKQTGDQKQEAA